MKNKRSFIGTLVFLFFLPLSVHAQEIDEELLARLKKMLKEEVKKEIKEEVLEEIQEKYVLVPKKENEKQRNLKDVEIAEEDEEGEENELLSYQLGQGLKVAGERLILRGFSDVTFEGKNSHPKHTSDKNENFFAIGQYDLFITSRLNDRISFLGETVFEIPEGSSEMIVDVERLLVKYSISDLLNISLGKYHTPIGYWNTAYHHGKFLHTTPFRPDIFRWEDEAGILPLHQIGVKIDGNLNLGPLAVGYALGLSNGRGRTPDKVQSIGDLNDQKAVNFSLDLRHSRMPGLAFGLSLYHDDIPRSEVSPIHGNMDEFIYGAHLTYLSGKNEFLAEILNIHHSNDGSKGSYDTLGYYLQMVRSCGKYKPYYRLDRINFDKNDPFFGADADSILKHSLGFSYDIATFNTLKFEFSFSDTSKEDVTAISLQTAFSF